MNAAHEVRVRKLRTFGRLARCICTFAMAFTVLLAAPWGLFNIFLPRPGQPFALDLGPVSFSGDHFDSFSLQIWILAIVAVDLVLLLWMLW